ncbi:helix-turn-helix domain-containing protein [Croceicoccus naphthovorans]|uniref:Uncharacterized protein n=1 Tax=Croceicoccus naphthovorans TaxID=1348774 RepID=A0A0G3XKW4_9SPHN|nr:helix-turn-helix domain-containing protein [Croceicoccus naphthovorans]AKM11882.1 hypothetical protein AB433_14565 [Croceicoccus naphthovorans]MBB3989152.1 transcriptional regulator with XRE-family HTH domain [Croceicoccus naphthovorans]
MHDDNEPSETTETTETTEAADVAAAAPTGTVGERLAAERERQGLTRAQIGERTKIGERHLDSIEEGRLADLPGRTYAIGFVRSYARALGMDENALVADVRNEFGMMEPQKPTRVLDHMEPGDPARVPSSKLAWGVAALLIAVVAIGAFAWRGFFLPAEDLPPIAAEEEPVAAAPAPTATASEAAIADGAVIFTATVDGIWVKFYDRNGRDLFQKQMAEGESFTIPQDADGPQLWTGRPDALTITIGGQAVPPLATEQRTIRDVPVDLESLRARPSGPGVPTR